MAEPPERSRFLLTAALSGVGSTPDLTGATSEDLSLLTDFFDGLGYQAETWLVTKPEDLKERLQRWAQSVGSRSPTTAVVYLTGRSTIDGADQYLLPVNRAGDPATRIAVNDLLALLAGGLTGTPVLVILDTSSVSEAAPSPSSGPEPSYFLGPDTRILTTAGVAQTVGEGMFVRAFVRAAGEAISAASPSVPAVDLDILVDDTRKALSGRQAISLAPATPGSKPPPFIPNPKYQSGIDLDAPTARTGRTRESELDLDAPTARGQGARPSAEPDDVAEEESEPSSEAAATPTPIVPFLAGYAADTVTGEDELDITADVESLCSVLMATQVQPPLSVGLFGDWGSGKSFFMQRMRERIDWIATESKLARDGGRPSDFCENVRQITFNAWHYVDANLWASLITRIFDGLLGGTDDQIEPLTAEQSRQQQRHAHQVLAKLESAELFAADARRQRDLAELQLHEKLKQQEVSSGKLDRLSDLAAQDIREVAQRNPAEVQQALGGLPPDLRNDLDVLAETYGLWGTLHDTWDKLGSRARWQTALLGLLAVALIVLGIVVAHSPALRTAPIVVAVVSLAGVVARSRPGLQRSRAAAQAASQSIDQAIHRKEAAANAEAARIQAEIDAARTRLEQADAEIAGIQDGRRLGEFIAARATSAEYQRGLGIIALVRRDLARLSRLMSDPDAGQPQQIDRIVLYIDDLDRCPAERVAEVLQAVHLLLAFPLFIVVVGADARWLLRSLELQYADLMTAEPGPGADEEDPEMALHWSATPQNYLDKIFQIPFSLKPMDAAGFDRLIRATVGLPEPVQPSASLPPTHGRAADRPARQDVTIGPDAAGAAPGPGPDSSPPPVRIPLTSSIAATRVSVGQVPGHVLAVALAEGNRLVVISRQGESPAVTVTTLDARTGALRASWATRCDEAALSPDGALVVARSATGLQLSDSWGGPGTRQIPGAFFAAGFSVDGARLTAVEPGALTVIDIEGNVRSYRDIREGENPGRWPVLPSGAVLTGVQEIWAEEMRHEGLEPVWPFERSAFSRDGSTMALLGAGYLLVADLPDGTRRHWMPLAFADDLAISPDGSEVAAVFGPAVYPAERPGIATDAVPENPPSIANVNHILVLDSATGSPVCQVALDRGTVVRNLAFSANGRLLVAGDDQGTVQVWSLAPATTNLSAQRLQLTEPELAFLARLSPLIRTPRAAKRLVNVYRLLRAPLDEAALARLLGDRDTAPEHPAVLLLLTVVTGFPDPAQAIIGELLQEPSGTWTQLLDKIRGEHQGKPDDPGTLRWKVFFDAYDQLDLTGLPDAVGVYSRWAAQTARYSFRTGRLLG